MIFIEFKKHFPPRAVEWLMGILLTSWGASVLTHPNLFHENPVWSHMLLLADQPTWGLFAFFIGLLRLMALFINGSWYRTPQLRIITAFLCCFVWTQIVLGIVNSEVDTVLMSLLPWFIVADIYSAFRAGADASRAKAIRDGEVTAIR